MIELGLMFEQIWHTFSGEAAWQTMTDLSRYHRIQASPGYREAANLIHQRLIRDGLEAEIHSYPANCEVQFWAAPSFQEWHCTDAKLHLVEPEDEAMALADFRSCPISLVQRSTSFDGTAEVIPLDNGTEEADYEGLEVAGKVVLSNGNIRRVWELAVKERGAVGILFDGMRAIPQVRPEGDLVNARQYTSFWWEPDDITCFGFVLTPRMGQMLRSLFKKGVSPVRIHAQVRSHLYDGKMEVVSAAIPGKSDEEFIVVAHLCHPRPSSNDNASGAAAALEAAFTLQSLIAGGKLPRPRRTIRFLWLPEINGMYAYLTDRQEELHKLIAGINLDMVGEHQNLTGSSWVIERPPDAVASFAPDLLARLRDQLPHLKGMPEVSKSHTGMGIYPLYRQAEVPFSGGSDHYVLSDPLVGVPTPMLIQWPDRFYHTSEDTPDKVDPNSLARSGALTAAYAYWLSAAEAKDAAWLGHDMIARFKVHLIEATEAALTEALTATTGECLAKIADSVDRHMAYLLSREKAALETLKRLAPVGCPVELLQDEATAVATRELGWAKEAIDLCAVTLGLKDLPPVQPRQLSDQERCASDLVPIRRIPGPIPVESHLRRLDAADRESWRKLLKTRDGHTPYTLTTLALFWADGQRSLLEIADLVEQESAQRDIELMIEFFRLLEKLGFVDL